MLVTIFAASAAFLGALIAAFVSSRNGRKDREHRDRMACLEDWRRQRDVATQLVRSADPGERKQGFAQLEILFADDAVAPQRDRDFIRQIKDLAQQAGDGRTLVGLATKCLEILDNCGPVTVGPGPTLPELAAIAETMNNRHLEIRTMFEQMRLAGIRMYGGLPPD